MSAKSPLKRLAVNWPLYLAAFACTLALAVISRVAFGYLEANGALKYVYATSGHGTTLEQICEVFTGTSVIALVALGGIVGALIAALFCLVGWQFARERQSAGAEKTAEAAAAPATGAAPTTESDAAASPATQTTPPSPAAHLAAASAWMLAALLVGVAAAVLVFLGTLSEVQLHSVASKLGGGASGAALMPVLVLAMFWTLLVCGCSMVLLITAAVLGRRASGPLRVLVLPVVLTLGIGLVLAWLSGNIFMRFDVVEVDYVALNGWLAVACAVNLALALLGLLVAACLAKATKTATTAKTDAAIAANTASKTDASARSKGGR
jgi:hypothetical protein